MLDIIKKGILAGLGATVTTKDKVESIMDDLVKRGKLSSEEAKETADKIVEESRKEFEDIKDEFSKRLDELIQKSNLASKEQVEALEQRIATLESKS